MQSQVDLFLVWLAMCYVNATIFSSLIANVHVWIILIIIGMVLLVGYVTISVFGIIMVLIDFKFITIYASFLTIDTILCLFSVIHCKAKQQQKQQQYKHVNNNNNAGKHTNDSQKESIHSWVILFGTFVQVLLYINTRFDSNDGDPFWMCFILALSLISSHRNKRNDKNKQSFMSRCSDLVSTMNITFTNPDYLSNMEKCDIWIIICYVTAGLCQNGTITGDIFGSRSAFIESLNIFFLFIMVSVFCYLIELLTLGNNHLRVIHVILFVIIGLIMIQIISQGYESLDWVYGIILFVVSFVTVELCREYEKYANLMVVVMLVLTTVAMILNSKAMRLDQMHQNSLNNTSITEWEYILFRVLMMTTSLIIEGITGLQHYRENCLSNSRDDELDLASFENNTKIYLTQCLTFAYDNNARFQSRVKQYFDANDKCLYQSAPCIVKVTSDYRNKCYPSVANIINFIRSSVKIDDMESGINTFINDVNSGNNEPLKECFVPHSILRIKTDFSDIIKNWQKMKDGQYCDIKLNLIYTNNENTQNMIVEAQFLLKFLLKAKKMGHKLCSIIRQNELIRNVQIKYYS